MSSKPKGRPTGAANVETIVDVETSRCPRCGSTEREPYSGTTAQAYAGTFGGRPYTHILRRRTRCCACGAARIDRAFENRPEK